MRYKSIEPLAWEIILARAEEALPQLEKGKEWKPFFREHHHKKTLQLILPFKALSRLEIEVLKEMQFPAVNYHNGDYKGARLFVIDVVELSKKNRPLAEKLVKIYNDKWEQRIGKLFLHYKL